METRLKEVLAVVNNKGGVGKTTTVQSLSAAIVRAHHDWCTYIDFVRLLHP